MPVVVPNRWGLIDLDHVAMQVRFIGTSQVTGLPYRCTTSIRRAPPISTKVWKRQGLFHRLMVNTIKIVLLCGLCSNEAA